METPERNIRLLIEYDGSRYHGWQQQEGLPTVQAEIARAVEKMTGVYPTLRVAGRTDAGVHAIGQVASFCTRSKVPLARFAPGINRFVPDDISIHRADEVPLAFDAKAHSVSKRYRYRVYEGPERAALETRAWHLRRRLDTDAMRRAAEHLIGELDFEAFRSTECDAEHAVRRMLSISVDRARRAPVGHVVDIVFHANAFARHMCRILAGTLVDVGLGRRTADDVKAVLASRDRRRAGMTAPPEGLTLLEVFYP